MVFSTGLAPATLGLFIDRGASMESIALACALYSLFAGLLALGAEAATRRRAQAEGR
jgi:hypothetical protein